MKTNWILLASLTPYVCIMAYDVWLHVNHRKVPPKERRAHGLSIGLLAIFFVMSILGQAVVAALALVCAIPIMVYDEVVFHKMLSKHERMIHNVAGACFVGYIVVWIVSIFY